jgi:hypothetical protein
MIEDLKVAAYLEDAGEDPASACKAIKEAGINYAVIRHVWTSNIKDLSDNGCVKLRGILSDSGITPIAIISSISDIPATDLPSIDEKIIDRTFNLVKYFNVPLLGLTCGQQTSVNADNQINDWLTRIANKSTSFNITSLVETTTKGQISTAAEFAVLLAKHSRIKLLYDPAQLIIRQNIDPFVKYWTLLKRYVGAIDVRDYKIGRGFKPVGFGDTNIARTVTDAMNSTYKGWFFFEPSLGRKHGTAQTKSDVFKMAFTAFKDSLGQN